MTDIAQEIPNAPGDIEGLRQYVEQELKSLRNDLFSLVNTDAVFNTSVAISGDFDVSNGFAGFGISTPNTLGHFFTGTTGVITSLIKLEGPFTTNDGSEGTAIDFVGSTGTTNIGARIAGVRTASGARCDLVFFAGRNTDISFEKARITEAGNMGVGTTSQFGGGVGVIGLANAGTNPATNPTGGGVLYCDGGALKYRGSSGTVTILAPA